MEAAVTGILSRIDATIGGLCPCGADPRPGSPYCSADCEPTHLGRDTDPRQAGDYATPMRWRPDLVTAADDTDLIPIGSQTCGYTGRHNAQVYERVSDPTVWHLRLDDGHRYVGCDLTGMGGRQDPISIEQAARIAEAWQRLERELGNSRHLEPGDPWADVMPTPFRPLVNSGEAVILREAGYREGIHFVVYAPEWTPATPTIDREQVQRAVNAMVRSAERAMNTLAAELAPVFASMQEPIRRHGPLLEQVVGEQPPTDPMERALWLRKRRNTGPGPDRLDGRRRRKR
jgi:hypothetical protein